MYIGFLTQIPDLFSNFYCLDEEFLDFFSSVPDISQNNAKIPEIF